MNLKTTLPLVLGSLLAVAAARASGLDNLEENLPTELEDAYPIEYYGREAQGSFRYQRTSQHKDLFTIEPRLELGPSANLQAAVHVPFVFGSAAEEEGIGQVGVSALYNFNNEGVYLPAFALAERVNFPTGPAPSSGRESHGVDPSTKLILSKTLGRGTHLQRVHLNLQWKHNSDRQPEERGDFYKLIAGYSMRFGADTIGILDYVREQELEKGKTSDILEVGVRRQVTPLLNVSLGGGAGLSKNSPDYRVTVGIQRSF